MKYKHLVEIDDVSVDNFDHSRSAKLKEAMAFFTVSDVIIAITLLINAVALLSSKFNYDEEDSDEEPDVGMPVHSSAAAKSSGGVKFDAATATGASGSAIDAGNGGPNSSSETERLLSDSTTAQSSGLTKVNSASSAGSTRSLGDKNMQKLMSSGCSSVDAAAGTVEGGNLRTNIRSSTGTSTALVRIHAIQNGVRRLSGVIVLWNIFFTILMLFVFRG